MTTTASPLDPNDVAAHAESVRALARRLVRDGGVAEDVAQETWLVALRGARRGDVPISWWLRGVVRNVVRHARRDDATRRRHETATPTRRETETPDALVERTELHHRLVGAVLALEEPYRATLLMRYFEELSAAEIARRAGVPAATVRSRLKRGLDMLRARLDGEHDGDRRAWAVAVAPFAWTDAPRSGISTIAKIAACLLLVAGAGAAAVAVRRWTVASEATTETTTSAATDDTRPASVASAAPRRGTGDRPVRVRAADVDPAPAADTSSEAAAPAQPGATAKDDGATGVSVEVVDENGKPVEGGTVKFDAANLMQLVDFPPDAMLKFVQAFSGDRALSAAGRVVLREVPKELDGFEIQAFARVAGFPPTEPGKFTIRAGKVEAMRLVAARPRTADVIVVDRTTDLPVANAAVVSASELERRGVAAEVVRGTTSPGAAVTGADGRCKVDGLGRGEHEFEVDAKGYVRGEATWTDGELCVRIVPQGQGGTVTTRVLGPDGKPLAGLRVRLYKTDRAVRTDAEGFAVFDAVPSGFAAFSLDIPDWCAACKSGDFSGAGAEPTASVNVEARGTYDLTLGFLPTGTASIDLRLVDETGAPLVGVAVEVSGVKRAEGVTDESGTARFVGLCAAKYFPHLTTAPRAGWWFDDIPLGEGGHAAKTYTLGSKTVRGRVVAGADRHGVAGVDVWIGGPSHGSTRTDADGRFELTRARAGTYALSADSEHVGARITGVTIPREGDVVLELVAYGRVAVRFLVADRPQLREATFRLLHTDGEDVGRPFETAKGDDDFVSPKVLPGAYEVEVALAGRTRRFPVEVTSDKTSVVEVRVP